MKSLEMPVCCGSEMSVIATLGHFWETYCTNCNGVVYVMKRSEEKILA